MSTETKKSVAKGIATITNAGAPVFAITKSDDGTFGWRSHGMMTITGRDGKSKRAYKFKKGFDSVQVAIAASLCYLARHAEVSKPEVVDYIEPERKGLPNRRLQDTAEFAEALKVAKSLKLPASVKKSLAA